MSVVLLDHRERCLLKLCLYLESLKVFFAFPWHIAFIFYFFKIPFLGKSDIKNKLGRFKEQGSSNWRLVTKFLWICACLCRVSAGQWKGRCMHQMSLCLTITWWLYLSWPWGLLQLEATGREAEMWKSEYGEYNMPDFFFLCFWWERDGTTVVVSSKDILVAVQLIGDSV